MWGCVSSMNNVSERAANRDGSPAAAETTTTTAAPTVDYFSVETSCAGPGIGYRLDSRVGYFGLTAVRVSVTANGGSQFLGEFGPGQRPQATTGLAPSTPVRFDLQPLDRAGQVISTDAIDIVTPAAPC